MRLSVILRFPMNVHRLRDASWQRWRKLKVPDDGLEAKLQLQGIQVMDAQEFVKTDSPLHNVTQSLEDTKPLYPQPFKQDFTHPHWHERSAKVLHNDSFPMEGVRQAQVLAKAVHIKSGLPPEILDLAQRRTLPQEDQRVKEVIQQAFLWDAHLDSLPQLRSLEIPCFNFRKRYGIPIKTSNELLIRNFFRLCEGNFPLEASRTLLSGPIELRLNIEREGFWVQFQLQSMVSVLSKHLLQPFFLDKSTNHQEVPDISPFNSLLNFHETNIYLSEDHLGYKTEGGFPYIQTSCFSHELPGSFTHVHPRWNTDRFSGCTLLYGFATAAVMARAKYGNGVKDLPEPITTQTIHFTGKEFEFGVFQLQSLDLDSNAPPQNVCWLSGQMKLFEECAYDYKEGRALFRGYNPKVFPLIRAFYEHGTKEPHSLPQKPSLQTQSSSPTLNNPD